MKLSKFEYKVYNFIREQDLLNDTKHVVVGVSGGADSICLLCVLKRISEYISDKNEDSFDLLAVHLNHNIRGEEAERDEKFVVDFCETNGIPIIVESRDVQGFANENGLSVEEAGRILRYEAFRKAADKFNDGDYVKIAVAHNENDNVETVLFNIVRGSGLKGLSGIPVKRDNIIRPLLCMRREEIETYLNDEKIDYVIDSTNLEVDYTRNKIRHKILPYLESNINQNVYSAIDNLSQHAMQADLYIENQVEKAYKKYVVGDTVKSEIKDEDYCIVSGVVRKCYANKSGALKDVTSTHISNIVRLFDSEVSREIELPYSIVAKRTYDGISFAEKKEEMESDSPKENVSFRVEKSEDEQIINGDGWKVRINSANKVEIDENIIKNKENKYTKYLDYDKINNDLFIRSRQNGDYLIVNSEGGRKKIKDYLSDMKIPRENRDEILMLADNSKVLWVIGYRISEDLKVTDETSRVLKVEFIKDENV